MRWHPEKSFAASMPKLLISMRLLAQAAWAGASPGRPRPCRVRCRLADVGHSHARQGASAAVPIGDHWRPAAEPLPAVPVERRRPTVRGLMGVDASSAAHRLACRRVQRLAIDELMREVCRGLEPLAAAHGVRLCFRQQVGRPLVSGDEERLYRMASIVVDAAVRTSAAGEQVDVCLAASRIGVAMSVTGGRVSSAAAAIPDGLERCYDGRGGMPPALARFDLSTARVIAEAHDGEIAFDAILDRGLRITVQLPAGRQLQAGDLRCV
jgi:hypothetical protein